MTELLNFTRMTGDLVKAMRACPQPVVAAIDGVCAGAGACIAMAADMRFGTARTKVAYLFTRVGLAGCDMGACAILPRIIGQGRAAELLFSGRSMSGDEAERWGFFNRLCPPDDCSTPHRSWRANSRTGPNFAHGMTKKMLDQEWNMGVDKAIEAEAQAQAHLHADRRFRARLSRLRRPSRSRCSRGIEMALLGFQKTLSCAGLTRASDGAPAADPRVKPAGDRIS